MTERAITLTAEAARAALPEGIGVRRAGFEERWRAEGWHRGVTLDRFLASGARRQPDSPITFYSEAAQETVTLGGLLERGHRLATALYERGLRPGDIVAVQLPNRLETAVAYYAVAALGLVLLPIVPIYGPAEVSFILRQSGAKCLIMPSVFRRIDARRDLPNLGALPDLVHVIIVGDDAPDGTIPWTELEPRGDRYPEPPSDPRSAALILYTSGTTAEPKGVIHSHDSLIAELVASPTPPPDTPGTVSLQPFPAGHTAGLSAILSPAHHHYPTILLESFAAEACAAVIEQYRVTAMAGTPYMISSLLDLAANGDYDLSSLVHGITGGGGVPPVLIERADGAGWRISRCYGATELPSLTSSDSPDPLEKRAYTDGRPIAGNLVRIVGEDGRDVPVGEEGEVATIGPEQAVAYTDPELTLAALLPDGWFLTGDIGMVDRDGFLTITDRKKDIIIRGGENISSREVEDALMRHPLVAEVAVVAAPDARYGEKVCAFVVLRGEAALDVPDVQRHFAQIGLARQKTPELIEVVTELPRTPAGKVQKGELRNRLRDA